MRYYCIAMSVVFAVHFHRVFSGWMRRKVMAYDARKRSQNGSMAVRVTTFPRAPWYRGEDR